MSLNKLKMHITFVKKIMANSELCPKCSEVSERLERDGLLENINYIAVADSKNPDSEGMLLALKYKVERAPFFLLCKVLMEKPIFLMCILSLSVLSKKKLG